MIPGEHHKLHLCAIWDSLMTECLHARNIKNPLNGYLMEACLKSKMRTCQSDGIVLDHSRYASHAWIQGSHRSWNRSHAIEQKWPNPLMQPWAYLSTFALQWMKNCWQQQSAWMERDQSLWAPLKIEPEKCGRGHLWAITSLSSCNLYLYYIKNSESNEQWIKGKLTEWVIIINPMLQLQIC